MPYEAPPVINVVGGIDLNGREGVLIEFGYQDANAADIDVSGLALYFEVDGVLRQALTAGNTVFRRLITITQEDVVEIYNAGTPHGASRAFVVRNETAVPPQVLWDGLITIRGFVEQPA